MLDQGSFITEQYGKVDTKDWHITSQKQEIDVKCSKCSFSQPYTIFHFFILRFFLCLQSLDVAYVVSYRCVYLVVEKSCSYMKQTTSMAGNIISGTLFGIQSKPAAGTSKETNVMITQVDITTATTGL